MIATEESARIAKIAFIKKRMRELGLNQRSLAVRAGCKPDAVRNLFTGKSKNWRGDIQTKIMSVISENRVRVLGSIGANDEVELIPGLDSVINTPIGADNLIQCKTFLVPFELSHKVVHAWEVDKSWEGPFLSAGDMVWTTELKYSDFEEFVDKEVLVTLANGRTFIKKIMKGSVAGKYSLMGMSVHGFIKDIDIAWCAMIVGHIKKLPS